MATFTIVNTQLFSQLSSVDQNGDDHPDGKLKFLLKYIKR